MRFSFIDIIAINDATEDAIKGDGDDKAAPHDDYHSATANVAFTAADITDDAPNTHAYASTHPFA